MPGPTLVVDSGCGKAACREACRQSNDSQCRFDAKVAHTQSGPMRVQVARRSAIGSRATPA